MPRHAVIEFDTDPETGDPLAAGTVINLADAGEDFAAELGWIACPDPGGVAAGVGIGWRWDGAAFSPPERPLGERKAAMRAGVNAARLRLQNGVAPTSAGLVDCDAQSRTALLGAAFSAMLALQSDAPFAIEWTLADNTSAVLDAEALTIVAQQVGEHVAACHAHARALKEAIEEAADHAGLDAIDLAAGWPAADAGEGA